jgi:outer membrane protein assembly factor BamB
MAGSVAVAGHVGYLGHYGNAVIAVDLADDRVLWTYRPGSFPFFSSPAVAADRLVIGGRDRRVHALRKQDGTPLWTAVTQGRVDASPLVAGDRVVVGSADGRLYLLRLSDGRKLATRDLGAVISASPAALGPLVVQGAEDGRVHAFTSLPGTNHP